MNALEGSTIQLKILSKDQLASLNKVLGQITDAEEHLWWCSNGLPFGQTISEFPINDKPVFSWSATNHEGEIVGHMELHKNRFGWVIGRVWVHPEYRRQGLARAMYLNVLAFASSFANQVGAFCNELNVPSKRLLLDLGFTVRGSAPEHTLEFFVIELTSIKAI
jgi:RimJ/RimL family protein N-acetyltransferase